MNQAETAPHFVRVNAGRKRRSHGTQPHVLPLDLHLDSYLTCVMSAFTVTGHWQGLLRRAETPAVMLVDDWRSIVPCGVYRMSNSLQDVNKCQLMRIVF